MTAGREIEGPLGRLAQVARAIGIHLIISTQRPTTNIITGFIKANFPTRIAFRVFSSIDSRTILDTTGADRLVGNGDMLISSGAEPVRVQCAFVDTAEIEELTEFIGSQQGYPDAMHLPEYIDDSEGGILEVDMKKKDPMFEDAARLVVQHQQGSTSLIQRKLSIGYNRAGRIIDQLEAAGIVGSFEGSKARDVLCPDFIALEQILKGIGVKLTDEEAYHIYIYLTDDSLIALGQNDPQAVSILDKFSSTVSAAPSVSMKFIMVTDDQVENIKDTIDRIGYPQQR